MRVRAVTGVRCRVIDATWVARSLPGRPFIHRGRIPDDRPVRKGLSAPWRRRLKVLPESPVARQSTAGGRTPRRFGLP
jgi:hypothetical protein